MIMKPQPFIYCIAILVVLFTACKKTDNIRDEDIKGKWKLVEVKLSLTPTVPVSYDYSQYNVVYDFKSDAVLMVSKDANMDTAGYVHEHGEHYYTIINDEDGYYVLKIDDYAYWYSVSSDELILDDSPVDGAKYYFVKLK